MGFDMTIRYWFSFYYQENSIPDVKSACGSLLSVSEYMINVLRGEEMF